MISGQFLKRKNLRLSDYDYSSPGFYFVTICAKNRDPKFGKVVGAGPGSTGLPSREKLRDSAGPKMVLNEVGLTVESVWKEMPDHYPGVEIDEFIVMPNHVHGIIALVGAQFIAPCDCTVTQGAINRAPTIGEIIRSFKAASTRRVRLAGMVDFGWQRNYYERVIRNEDELNKIRQYVSNNPMTWEQDPERVSSNTL